MASELKVDKIFNAGGDQDSGINLATNDTIKFDIATSTKATMASTGIVTIVGEGGTVTTNLQQGLLKAWANLDGSGTVGVNDSFNTTGITDNGTGNYTVTIANDLANGNGAMSGYSIMDGLVYGDVNDVSSAGTFRMRVVVGNSNSLMDPDEFHVQIAGDLA